MNAPHHPRAILTRRHARPRLLLLAASLVVVSSCGDDAASRAGVEAVRLLDRLDDLVVTSAVDFGSTAEPALQRIEVEEFDDVDEQRVLVRDAEWIAEVIPFAFRPDTSSGPLHSVVDVEGGRALLMHRAGVLLRPFRHAGGGAVRVRLRMRGEPSSAPQIIQVDEPLGASRLADKATLKEHVFAAARWQRIVALPGGDPDDDGFRQHEVTFPMRDGARGLIVVVAAGDREVTVDRIEVHRVPPMAQWRMQRPVAHFDDPRVRHHEVDAEFRESLLVATPAEVTGTVVVPKRAPRFTFGLAAAPGSPRVEVQLHIRFEPSHGDTLVHTVRFPARRKTWFDAQVDLERIAGQTVDMTIRVEATDGASTVGVALANPTIDGLPPDGVHPETVVVVSLDTVRRDRLSAYGYSALTSPHVAALAADGVRFDTAISPSSWTLPSHASLFTGQAPERHGVISDRRRLSRSHRPTLADRYRAAGYQTVAVTAGGMVHADFGFAAGFESYSVLEPVPMGDVDEARRQRNDAQRARLRRLLDGERRRPLFLFVHTYAAHDFLASDEDLRELGVPDGKLDAHPRGFDTTESREALAAAQAAGHDDEWIASVRTVYDGTVRAADRLVGDLTDAIERDGHEDRATFVVLSDHGEELYEHGWVGHGRGLSEELVRVPLIIRAPGVDPRVVADVVSITDVAPTLLELSGLPPAPDHDGRSLVPLLRGHAMPPVPAIAHSRGVHALRGEQYKLVQSGDDPSVAERVAVFDLQRDPGEERDLSRDRVKLHDSLVRALRVRRERLLRLAAEADEHRLSPERIAELRALGYLDAGK